MKLPAFAALLFTATAQAWDAAGHMLVDQIAWDQMKPAARERVTKLVHELEVTHNEGEPYNFVTSGCWMDDMRSKKGYEWSKWHYVTIPWTADGVAFELPAPPHIVWAIEQVTETLKDRESAVAKASEAVAMLIHLIGDLHQPLHATDRDDRGGNGVLIHGVPFTDLWPGTLPNLHAFWDKAFRFDARDGRIGEMWEAPFAVERPKAPGDGIIAAEAAKIAKQFPPASLPELEAHQDVISWAKESHALGCKSAYPADADPADDHHVITLTPDFAHASRQIAERQIALAGYRLARVLNELFTPAK